MRTSPYSTCTPPVGGAKQARPELTDHCRPRGRRTYPEHVYPATGQARCRRCSGGHAFCRRAFC
ncbi:hypothetical protein [Streptomyces sp. NWU49]|uniref:hypothetical protein n=1 Tax=Streptomyces sp. NWU49 TaxID=2201153 RepID=UPI0011B6DD82|nr:hypothetical protein [Streptomyces sp. NWU49]